MKSITSQALSVPGASGVRMTVLTSPDTRSIHELRLGMSVNARLPLFSVVGLPLGSEDNLTGTH